MVRGQIEKERSIPVEFIFPIAVLAVVFGFLGMWIALQKRREQQEGFILGLLFGPLGVLIEAVLPTIAEPTSPQPQRALTGEELERRREQRRRHEALLEAQRLAAERELEEWRKAREETLRREAEARERYIRETKAALVQGFRTLWLSLPDWLKMTAVGLVLGLVLCTPFYFYWPKPFTPPPTGEPVISKTKSVAPSPAPQPPIQEKEAQARAELERDKQYRSEESRSRILARIPPLLKPVEEDRPLDEVDLKAREYEKAGDFENAAICYKVLIEENPDTPQAKRAVEKLSKWGKQ